VAGTTGKTSPYTERFLEMLQGGPVEKEYAIATLAGLVAPGPAWRTYIRTRKDNWRKRGNDPDDFKPPASIEDGVRSGQRQMLVQAFNQLKTRGRIEQYRDENDRVMYRYLRDVIVLRGEAKRAAVLKGIETMRRELPPDFFSERARRAAATRTPEERSEIAKKGWLNKTPEERAAIIQKGLDAQPPGARAASIKAGWAKKSPEQRNAEAKRRWATIDPEERRRRALKGVETRRKRAWFRERAERKDDSVSTGPEERVQPDRSGGEGGAASDHEGEVG
jgi:hypothetical protein